MVVNITIKLLASANRIRNNQLSVSEKCSICASPINIYKK